MRFGPGWTGKDRSPVGSQHMKFTYEFANQKYTIEIEKTSTGYRAVLNGQEYPIQIVRAEPGELAYVVSDQSETAYWAVDGLRRWVFVEGRVFVLTAGLPGAREKRGEHAHGDQDIIRAPMPGHVRAVQVAQGQQVVQGETLLVLEAMKMEIRIQAPRSGRLAKLSAQVGQAVDRDQVLGEIVA